MLKKLLSALLAALLLLSGVAFADTQKDYDTLRVAGFTPMTGNFFTTMWGNNTADADVRAMLHGCSLVTFDAATGSFAVDPTVVTGFVARGNDYGDHIYNIVLANDLKWSDGTPVTAKDYLFSVLFRIDPVVKKAGGTPEDFSFIKGVNDYLAKRTETVTGLRLINDYQFEVTIAANALPNFYELSYLDIEPVPAHVVAPGIVAEDAGDGAALSRPLSESQMNRNVTGRNGYLKKPSVVCGPYTLESFDGTTATFKKNPNYKGDAQGNVPAFETVTYTVTTADKAADLLKEGKIDLINKTLSDTAVSAMMQLTAEGNAVTAYARSGLSFISFCTERPAVADVNVRKALACLFDKEGFTQAVAGANGIAAGGFYGLGQWMNQIVSKTMPAPVAELSENATAQEKREYEKAIAEWEKLSLDKVAAYDGGLEEAVKYLNKSDYRFGRNGANYKEGTRYTKNGNALKLTLLCPKETGVKSALVTYFAEPAKEAGIQIDVREVAWNELLDSYYRNKKRTCDMIYTAMNFDAAFDPSVLFDPADAAQGMSNRSGIRDNKLYDLAVAMRKTEPGDTLNYCKKWVSFVEYTQQVLPVLPVYSNVYFDFSVEALRNYNVSSYASWPQAAVPAYLSDAMPEETGEVVVAP
ncbi:MAG: ABC transporter substrate-binding protein [Clostridia bacterium]|nr:ABC transporter substrate-binding protein [Clostridia bacterium]